MSRYPQAQRSAEQNKEPDEYRKEGVPGVQSSVRRDVALLIFLTLVGCYAYFWQARCWNSASRLMLTYAMGDRWTITIDGLESQTYDRAQVGGHYYSDKAPGQSFLGFPIYLVAKLAGVRHPLGQPPIAYWWPDYILTVATSGVLTAALGVMIYVVALWLGARQWPATVAALSYGLGTPAFTYATLFYGHQSAAFCAFLSFVILYRNFRARQCSSMSMFGAGLLAGYAAVVEYPMALISAALVAYGGWSCRRLRGLLAFCLGGGICAVSLAGYHTIAFGSPLRAGYFSETEPQFQAVYSEANPIGLTWPKLAAACQILWSPRGLVLYAPVTLAAVVGIPVLSLRRQWALVFVVVWGFGSIFLVNASHPTWTGGFATGPRYSLPGVVFLMIAVAATVATPSEWPWKAVALLGFLGFLVVGSCTAYGGRLPDIGTPGGENPLIESVLPAWQQGHFDRNLGKLLLYRWWWDIAPQWKWVAFLPLVVFVASMIALLKNRCVRVDTQCLTLTEPDSTK